MIKEVKDRVEGIKLTKDDHKTYSDVQGEIDAFLSEAINDILSIKKSLKDRFTKVQQGGNKRSQSNNRRSRSKKPTKDEEGQ